MCMVVVVVSQGYLGNTDGEKLAVTEISAIFSQHGNHKAVVESANNARQRDVFDLHREQSQRIRKGPAEWISMVLPGTYLRTHRSLIGILAHRQILKLSRMVSTLLSAQLVVVVLNCCAH